MSGLSTRDGFAVIERQAAGGLSVETFGTLDALVERQAGILMRRALWGLGRTPGGADQARGVVTWLRGLADELAAEIDRHASGDQAAALAADDVDAGRS